MRESIKQFVALCAGCLPMAEPIYEFGARQVPGQVGFADLRPLFPRASSTSGPTSSPARAPT